MYAETTFEGVGFGLGFSVVIDPVSNRVLSTAGTKTIVALPARVELATTRIEAGCSLH